MGAMTFWRSIGADEAEEGEAAARSRVLNVARKTAIPVARERNPAGPHFRNMAIVLGVGSDPRRVFSFLIFLEGQF
jgi:hypothetical protein